VLGACVFVYHGQLSRYRQVVLVTLLQLPRSLPCESVQPHSLGLATVDRIRRTYGNRITVPVTVPAAAVAAHSRTRYADSRWPSITVYCTAVYGRRTGVRVPNKVGIILGSRVRSSSYFSVLSDPVLFCHNLNGTSSA
jgi:hypothetical protein